MKYLRAPKHLEQVRVYWNLHLLEYSVMDSRRHVIAHSREILLIGPDFIVNAAGRARVRREKKKNVHAFVEGAIYMRPYAWEDPVLKIRDQKFMLSQRARYNPYEDSQFVTEDDDVPVRRYMRPKAYMRIYSDKPVININSPQSVQEDAVLNGVSYEQRVGWLNLQPAAY